MHISTTQPASLLLVFLSSGDDVLELRELVYRTVEDAVNPVLRTRGIPVRLDLDGWDRTPAHRVPPGETVNTEFVGRACASHLVLGLLHKKLGEGTREELEAVLAKEDVQLSVIWCVEREAEWPRTPAGQWLGERQQEILADRAGVLGGNGPAVAIFKVLLDAALGAAGLDRKVLVHEQR